MSRNMANKDTKIVTSQLIKEEKSTATTTTITTKAKKTKFESKIKDAPLAAPSEVGKAEQTADSSETSGHSVELLTEPPAQKTPNDKKKKKLKKSTKMESDKQNISVKSTLTKFDALQKRNLIHNPQEEKDTVCRICSKPVYKMEEIKAEKNVFHKNCFRCTDCKKNLKLDNYQSHEGVLYCLIHFKLLFSPKNVTNDGPEKSRKPELIIRENEPEELPSDVVRGSIKSDLGLEELQKLDVRSKFQVFQNNSEQKSPQETHPRSRSPSHGAGVNRSTSILSKLARLQAHGCNTGTTTIVNMDNNNVEDEEDDSDGDGASSVEQEDVGDNDDILLMNSKKRTQRERPIGIGNAMNDIKTKFEKGHIMTKEERREERKQEIQNIRSRLFMGKQARIKEMYQQAVADAEQTITSSGKKPDIEIGETAAHTLRERFEKGEMFKGDRSDNDITGGLNDDAEVFESAISKKSRSIFMELDANQSSGKNQFEPPTPTRSKSVNPLKTSSSKILPGQHEENHQENAFTPQENIIKYDEKPEDVEIKTSEISRKFKFFETYRPTECKKKEFRITPPRRMPTSSDDEDNDERSNEPVKDTNILEKSQTTSLMLNKFREMEQSNHRSEMRNDGPRPLKCFTPPPPDQNRRVLQDDESDGYTSQDDEEDESADDGTDDADNRMQRDETYRLNDGALMEAQAAARAKVLRAKFEKWEASEVQRELMEGRHDLYLDYADSENVESTKSIRERFENMKNEETKVSTRPRCQVNRFV